MRSPTSRHRRLHAVPPRPALLDELARLLDETWQDEPGPVLFHALAPGGDHVDLGALPLEPGTHPFSAVAGFVAPPEWDVFGVRALGTARHLGEGTSERIAATFLASRDGGEASLLRTGGAVVAPPGPPQGTIPDLCRRVLGLPTPPAPPSTALLWATAWLDAVLARWSAEPAGRRHLSASFAAVAAHHPAAQAGAVLASADDVADAGRQHAALWPWPRLRAEPGAVRLPDGPLPADVAAWMDDGFFARWCLGAYPHPAELAQDVMALLDPHVGAELTAAVEGLLPQA